MEIAPGIHHIRCPYGTSVVYVTAIIPPRADDPAGVTLIDSGTAQVPLESLAPYLAKHGRTLADVRRILNTHGHLDHAGGNGIVKAASGAEVRLHPADWRLATDPAYQYHVMAGRWLELIGQTDTTGFLTPEAYTRAMQVVSPDGPIADGAEFDCGPIRLRAIHAPGHTAGLVCFYWPEGRLLITGDGVQGASSRPGSFPIVLEAAHYIPSLERLRALDVETLLLAHPFRGLDDDGMPVRQGKAVAAFLEESLIIARALVDAITAARGLPPTGLLRAVVDRLRPLLKIPAGTIPPYALPTVFSGVYSSGKSAIV